MKTQGSPTFVWDGLLLKAAPNLDMTSNMEMVRSGP